MTLPVELQNGISREAINELPIRRYEGEVRLVETPADLERAAADFAGERVVGFDTETRPGFRVGQHYPPALARVPPGRAVCLLPLARLGCSAVLASRLGSATLRAGVGPAKALRQLQPLFA